jgi:carbon-monoxide dehydrogenase small subunit
MNKITVNLKVNGRDVRVETAPNRTLLDVLREDLNLTGAKDGCGGEGECGACTVFLDGAAVNACLVLAGQVEDSVVLTIEGLGNEKNPHPLQTAFVAHGAVQCGFCTPGAVMAAAGLLADNPAPAEDQIREALSGNLCRCTGYSKIISAVQTAAEELADE